MTFSPDHERICCKQRILENLEADAGKKGFDEETFGTSRPPFLLQLGKMGFETDEAFLGDETGTSVPSQDPAIMP